ncbi:ectoine utilization protein EutC [Planococcus antarcticus DSM 14505]|uniref:Cyclodeaminase n=1 Tax=Planococcus antarcticus DSM 14505 TaxID=1185653 RepID=A0A1C7DJM5_9BACL|nr:cyclodeaminase [Planococcus antarcticus]ANU11780.1 cyclodeaminase [Planococcus antarcticus DSM 14505]EIM06362.1 ectoine utilization protein EutC [Planococcus antarcticus DSM 14505]
MLIFTEQELKQYITLNQEALTVIEDSFNKLAQRQVVMPPIMRLDIPDHNGEVDVKTAYVEGKELFAIKVSSGFFDNPKIGLPSGSGFMMLMSTRTGIPQALFLDNGYLTEVRTAAAGAIAADCLSQKDIETVGIIGAGSQARFQLKALALVRDFKKVLVYSRSAEPAHQYSEEMSAALGITVQVAESAEQVIRNSQLVVTTTPATEPIVKAEWLHPGLHITAMGSDAERKQELETEVLAVADKVVCDTKAQCIRLGELHHALASGTLKDASEVIELGQITSKELKGRDNDEQITVCDLTGTGVQDTAIAGFAYQELKKQRRRMEIDNEYGVQKN